jgi:hypothetical protein
MGLLRRAAFCTLLLIGFTLGALAQDGKGDGKGDATGNATTETRLPKLTGKERLGPKWTDEQRIDNCRVPVDKRGRKSRPSTCSDAPSS